MSDLGLTADHLEAYRSAEVIFVCQDGFTLAPSRIRCYTFARACRAQGMRAEVLSFHDHLGASQQGSGIYQMTDAEKFDLIARATRLLLTNSDAILYMQKFSYHSFAVCAAAAANGNRLVLDYDDYDLHWLSFPRLQTFLQGVESPVNTLSVAKRAAMTVVSSRRLYEMFLEHSPNLHLLPTGTDLSVFDARLRKTVRRRDDLVEILWLGDIWGETIARDLVFAVDAYAALPPGVRDRARFTIIGFGAAWEPFKAFAAERYAGVPNLVLEERIAPAEAPARMAAADIGVLPLADNVFNACKSPTKMFEFMAMKVAVCGTPVGEVAHILRDGESGMLAADAEGFAQRLGVLISNSVLRRTMAARAYEIVRGDYHLDAIGAKLVDLLNELPDNAPPGT